MPDPRVTDPVRPHESDAFYLPDDVPSPVEPQDAGRYLHGLMQLNAELADRFRREKLDFQWSDTATTQTNASGNATFPIFQAGAGFYVSTNRLVVECATFDASGAVTPAAPFVGGWLGIFVTDDPTNVSQGQMVDFMPTTAGGQLIPAVAEYGSDTRTGPLVRSGEYLVCAIRSGPVSKRVSVNFQATRWGVES